MGRLFASWILRAPGRRQLCFPQSIITRTLDLYFRIQEDIFFLFLIKRKMDRSPDKRFESGGLCVKLPSGVQLLCYCVSSKQGRQKGAI